MCVNSAMSANGPEEADVVTMSKWMHEWVWIPTNYFTWYTRCHAVESIFVHLLKYHTVLHFTGVFVVYITLYTYYTTVNRDKNFKTIKTIVLVTIQSYAILLLQGYNITVFAESVTKVTIPLYIYYWAYSGFWSSGERYINSLYFFGPLISINRVA